MSYQVEKRVLINSSQLDLFCVGCWNERGAQCHHTYCCIHCFGGETKVAFLTLRCLSILLYWIVSVSSPDFDVKITHTPFVPVLNGSNTVLPPVSQRFDKKVAEFSFDSWCFYPLWPCGLWVRSSTFHRRSSARPFVIAAIFRSLYPARITS